MAKSKGTEKNFETSLSALEKVVAQLESGDLPLNQALELFEEGVGLARQCQSQLQEAEHKVELLLRERGEIKIVPFETADSKQVETRAFPQQESLTEDKISLPKDANDEEDELEDTFPF